LPSGGGLCHQCREDLVGCQKVEYFAGSVVEALGDDVEVGLAVGAKVSPLGEILPDQPVGVFVAAPLPRAVGISEVDLDARILGEVFVAGHFGSPIVGEGFAQGRGDVLEGAFEGAACGCGVEAVHPGEDEEAAVTLDERSNSGAVGGTFYQIARDCQ
jgi:hypothetical protein